MSVGSNAGRLVTSFSRVRASNPGPHPGLQAAQTLWEFVRLCRKKIRPKFHFLTKIEIKRTRRRLYSGLQVTGMIEGFLGLEIFDFGIFLGRKSLASILLGSLV